MWRTVLLSLFLLGGLASRADATLLSYTLAGPLGPMTPGVCPAGDTDGDCLDDAREAQLALAVTPMVFYDEADDCGAWWSAGTTIHNRRRDFVQVRPHGRTVAWWPSSADPKWVQVTFHMLYPHDCARGRLGDPQKVEYWLYSYDSRTWTLAGARYWLDDAGWQMWTGEQMARLPHDLGTTSPLVAAEEDEHSSFPGSDYWVDDCYPGQPWYDTQDCFVTSRLNDDYHGHWYEMVTPLADLGGPAPERWRPSAYVTVFGSRAYSRLDTGHGYLNEYWNAEPGASAFCGWKCAWQQPDGTCYWAAHGTNRCAIGLAQRVDAYAFTVQPVCGDHRCEANETATSCPTDCGNSCAGHCGGSAPSRCMCDADCVQYGDCCPDACNACGYCGGNGGYL